MPKRTEQIPIAFDQLINTDETISSAAWRKRHEGKRWALLRKMIDSLFFWQENHCESAYLSEKNRLQCPPELRGES